MNLHVCEDPFTVLVSANLHLTWNGMMPSQRCHHSVGRVILAVCARRQHFLSMSHAGRELEWLMPCCQQLHKSCFSWVDHEHLRLLHTTAEHLTQESKSIGRRKIQQSEGLFEAENRRSGGQTATSWRQCHIQSAK